MGNVYVVQEPARRKDRSTGSLLPPIDVSAAAKFGKFKVLLPPGDIILSTQPAIWELKKKLKTFCDDDYLLLIGDPVAIGLASSIAAEMNSGRVKFLRWAKSEFDYIVVEADLHQRGER
jgi:hypothetical protein